MLLEVSRCEGDIQNDSLYIVIGIKPISWPDKTLETTKNEV